MADITITEGDTLEVDYSLENTGDGTGTFDPRLLVQGVQEDQDTGITLDPTQTATGTLQWPTESGDAVTDALAEAVTDDTSDSITVTVESAIPDSGVLRWTFDDSDTEGGAALDIWNNFDGSINGATTGATGANQTYTTNEAYSFDGTNDNVTVASDLGLVEPYSFGFWINTSASDNLVVGEWATRSDADGRLFIQLNNSGGTNTDGQLRVFSTDGTNTGNTSPSTNPNITDGTWNHVIVVRDTSLTNNAAISINGSDVSLTGSLISGDANNSATGWVLGMGDNQTQPYVGSIDDFRIYNKGLSATERSDLYNMGSI